MKVAGFPSGLLSLLDAQAFGESPDEVASVIAPVVDLTPLYALSKQAFVGATFNPPAFGTFNAAAVVPPGEVWRVLAVRGTGICAAATTVTVTPALVGNTSGTQHLANSLAVAANQTRSVAWTGDLWATAGTSIGCTGDEITGAPILSVSCLVQRFRV